MLAPLGGAYAVAGLLLPARAGGVEVKAAAVAIQCFGIVLQRHVLVAQQQVGFGIGGVYVECLVEQLDGLLVLAYGRFIGSLLEHWLTPLGLRQHKGGQ